MKVCSRCGEEKLRADFPKIGGTLCKPCKNAKARETYAEDLEVNRAKKRVVWNRNYDTIKRREKARKWRKQYPEKLSAANRKTYHYRRNWIKSKPGYSTYYSNLYRKAIQQATPPWVKNDPWQLEQIAEKYRYAKLMEEFRCEYFHIDHIEPINGKTSCGLHVHWNLQIIPALENIKKSNKLIVQPTT